MPETAYEAERVWWRYNGQNGRYYLKADVVIDGQLYADVVFDGDSRIAVEYDGQPLHQHPDLIGKCIEDYLITRDRTSGKNS